MFGFSLLEMLIVFMLILIVLAFCIPSQKVFLEDSYAKTSNKSLLHAIHLARIEALVRNHPIRVCKSDNQKNCSGTWSQGFIVVDNNDVIFQFKPPNNQGQIYHRFFPAGKDSLEFLPSGKLDFENGTFWYCRSSKMNPDWAIIMSQSGRARTVFANDAGHIKDEKGRLLLCRD